MHGSPITRIFAALFVTFSLVAAQAALAQSAGIEQRLEKALRELGFPDGKLPALKPAFGNYVDTIQVGNLLFLSSAAPQRPDGQFVKGRVPDQVSLGDAIVAAKLACVRQINRLKLALGDLGRVKRIVYVRGKTLAQEGFTDHTKITDGCSAFFVEVFGEDGKHTRTSEGLGSAPFGVTFEVDVVVELRS
jgi:enamine deaminase RidA (YjgF/YER057c/UK114 family)